MPKDHGQSNTSCIQEGCRGTFKRDGHQANIVMLPVPLAWPRCPTLFHKRAVAQRKPKYLSLEKLAQCHQAVYTWENSLIGSPSHLIHADFHLDIFGILNDETLPSQNINHSIPKQDSSTHLVSNLSQLNHFVKPFWLRISMIAQVRLVLCQGLWLVAFDLENASQSQVLSYFLPIATARQDYASGHPFGMDIAPRVFIKLTKPVAQIPTG